MDVVTAEFEFELTPDSGMLSTPGTSPKHGHKPRAKASSGGSVAAANQRVQPAMPCVVESGTAITIQDDHGNDVIDLTATIVTDVQSPATVSSGESVVYIPKRRGRTVSNGPKPSSRNLLERTKVVNNCQGKSSYRPSDPYEKEVTDRWVDSV